MVRRYGAKRINLELFPNERNADAVRELIDLIEARINLSAAESYQRGLAEGQRLRTEHVDALTCGAYEDGKGDGRAEGRRQVTADWKREWGIRYADGAPVGAEESEAEARRVAALWGWPYEAVSRVVGQWETAEQAPCPTCSGPIRETVDMVCQTCGTDYAPDSQPADGDGDR